jgi:hypothetical protein
MTDAPTDPGAAAPGKAQLLALLDKLKEKAERAYVEQGQFFQLINTMKELIEHPPPYTDAAAFRQHLTERINNACDTLDKMRELLPSEMRIDRP